MISMWQVQLGNHPIALHLFPNGQVAFTPLKDLNNTIIDYSDFMEVYITKFGIDLVDTETRDEEHITFGVVTSYKDKLMLLRWLESFKLHYNSSF